MLTVYKDQLFTDITEILVPATFRQGSVSQYENDYVYACYVSSSSYCTFLSQVEHKWAFNPLRVSGFTLKPPLNYFLSYLHGGLHMKPPSVGCLMVQHCLKFTGFYVSNTNLCQIIS